MVAISFKKNKKFKKLIKTVAKLLATVFINLIIKFCKEMDV